MTSKNSTLAKRTTTALISALALCVFGCTHTKQVAQPKQEVVQTPVAPAPSPTSNWTKQAAGIWTLSLPPSFKAEVPDEGLPEGLDAAFRSESDNMLVILGSESITGTLEEYLLSVQMGFVMNEGEVLEKGIMKPEASIDGMETAVLLIKMDRAQPVLLAHLSARSNKGKVYNFECGTDAIGHEAIKHNMDMCVEIVKTVKVRR